MIYDKDQGYSMLPWTVIEWAESSIQGSSPEVEMWGFGVYQNYF